MKYFVANSSDYTAIAQSYIAPCETQADKKYRINAYAHKVTERHHHHLEVCYNSYYCNSFVVVVVVICYDYY